MTFLAVKNFEKFQHYKQRNPPWIKLHSSILFDYDFGRLPDASKLHVVGLWLLASKSGNRIPDDPRWIAQRLGASEPVDVELLVSSGFIFRVAGAASPTLAGDASEPLALCMQEPIPRRGEKRREEKKLPRNKCVAAGTNGKGRATWLTPYSEAWHARFGSEAKPPFGQMARYVRPLDEEHGAKIVAVEFAAFLRTTDLTHMSLAKFPSGYGSWLTSQGGKIPELPAIQEGRFVDEL
jgi:hypothetical protein